MKKELLYVFIGYVFLYNYHINKDFIYQKHQHQVSLSNFIQTLYPLIFKIRPHNL